MTEDENLTSDFNTRAIQAVTESQRESTPSQPNRFRPSRSQLMGMLWAAIRRDNGRNG